MRRCCIWRCCGGRALCRPGPWPGSCGGTAAAIEAAETALRELGLVAPAETPPAPAEERPVYQRADVAERLEHSEAFQAADRGRWR